MTVASIFVNLLLLLLHMYGNQAMEASTPNTFASMLSKRRFLSPRDLQGSYSRFLEVSENSTLCPNTVAHNTNGVLRPSGYIHIPLNDIAQDGQPCVGQGELVLRFRRRMNSAEIEQEFNITADATGIDKMVREILLALDAFYFGRQTTERSCQGSGLPPKAAFFFTSQSKPFAANVGVPFRRNPKIMFIVDKTRVCGFSGSFVQTRPTIVGKQPIPEVSMTPKPHATPTPFMAAKSPANTMETKTPGPPRTEPSENGDSLPKRPNLNEEKRMPNASGSPSKPLAAPVPSKSYKETKDPLKEDNSGQGMKRDMKSSTLVPTARSESDNNSRIGNTSQHHDQKMHRKLDEYVISSSPSPSHLPRKPSRGPMSFPEKHYREKGGASSNPSRSPTTNTLPTEDLSSSPSSSPPAKAYEVILPSMSPRGKALPSPSMNASSSHPHRIVFTANDVSPSHPMQVLSGEGNQSNSHSHGDLPDSRPIMNTTIMPEPSEWEVIIGDSGSTCFPSSATVMLSTGKIKRMEELSVGISVSVGNGKSSAIIDFSHFDRTIVSGFLHLKTDSGKNLTVTPPHFVYTNHGLVPAAKVTPGDYLKLSDGRPSRVVSISRILSRGLFNPHTSHGDISVDGFVVSTYTLAAAPMTAHSLLAPIRFLYELGFRTSIAFKLSKQETILQAFRSLLSSNTHSIMF